MLAQQNGGPPLHTYLLFFAAWLCASCILATVASASRMSFGAWLLIGLVSPLLILILGTEYLFTRLPGLRPKVAPMEGEIAR
jgi:ammonia channel protein AmtB